MAFCLTVLGDDGNSSGEIISGCWFLFRVMFLYPELAILFFLSILEGLTIAVFVGIIYYLYAENGVNRQFNARQNTMKYRVPPSPLKTSSRSERFEVSIS